MRTLAVAVALVVSACARTPPIVLAEDRSPPAASPKAPTTAPVEARVSPAPPPVEAPPARPSERQTLNVESGRAVEVYPPLDPAEGAAPLVVFLHATCMEPIDVCDFWSGAGRHGRWLVCPAGPGTCYGAPDWSGTPQVKVDALGAALARVDAAYGAWVDHDRGDVLIGYSRGAFAARDILYERQGRFSALILISAAVSPDPARLRAAGIRRAVMATGDLDVSRPTMVRAARTLAAAGIPSKFVSLGKIGHWLPEDLEPILREAIAWVAPPVS
jgi:hypothetical protein